MEQTCRFCQCNFTITEEDQEFYRRVSPVIGGELFQVPPPTHCPDCRQRRRLAICNERFLYGGTCGLCGKRTPTEHPPHAEQLIYCRECWHSDKWDPRDYGADPDFSRPFFEQWVELKRRTPAQALSIQGYCENSEYIHLAGFSKNSYLIMHADHCEDTYYGYGMKHCVGCVDGFYNIYSQYCYDCIDCHQCYGLIGCQDCTNCNESFFLRDCSGCTNCFLSTGLRNASYVYRNQQLSKEDYQARIAEYDLGSYSRYQNCKGERRELEADHTYKAFQGHNLENCTGCHMYNCKDVHYSFDCDDVEGGKYLYQVVIGAKDVYDIYQYGNNLQLSYDSSIVGLNSYRLLFCQETHTCTETIYGWYMENCKHCFGCANMHHQSYCVLNKQYSPDEYNDVASKLIRHMQETGEWGEFLPVQKILFGYNRTTAQLYYPLSKSDAESRGIPWDEYEAPIADIDNVLDAQSLPDNIREVDDSICRSAIRCATTGRLFRITPHELSFYKKHNVPLPRLSPDQRHVNRFKLRNPRQLWTRPCGSCGEGMLTNVASDRPEKVFCEPCYLGALY